MQKSFEERGKLLWLKYTGFKVFFPIPTKAMLSAVEIQWPQIN